MSEDKVWPVEEMMPYDEFTDRIEILRELESWVKNIAQMNSSSTTILSPRRLGKTALLDRLVNTVFFQPENRVAPFYFKMKREEVTLRKFLLEYATTFFRQFLAYCYQDPALYKKEYLKMEKLLDLPCDHPAIPQAREMITDFLDRYNSSDTEDARNHWDAFVKVPELLASFTGTRVAVIIDEFQDMKFYIYDLPEEIVMKIRDNKGSEIIYRSTDLTATYDRQSQSRKAPMLVSGSAVSLIFRTVMGGPLGGRFGFKYLKPLSIPDGATLITKLAEKKGLVIHEENAVYLSAAVGGHPYYLYCCSESEAPEKSFDSRVQIDRVLEYEVRNGKIFGFWETHFGQHKEWVNADNDQNLGKKIMYYFTRYNNQPVQIDDIARILEVNPALVEEKIEKLYFADLVYRTEFKYYSFNDIMLMRYIQHRYEKDLENIEKIDLREQGYDNVIKGAFLELVVENVMSKFNRETLPGRWFGQEQPVRVPFFRYVGNKTVKSERGPEYQIDVYGSGDEGFRGAGYLWTVECKYKKRPMTLPEVQKAFSAGQSFKQAEYSQRDKVISLQVWVVSTGSFTADALAFIRENGIYYSGHTEMNEIFRYYGGRLPIPVPEDSP